MINWLNNSEWRQLITNILIEIKFKFLGKFVIWFDFL